MSTDTPSQGTSSAPSTAPRSLASRLLHPRLSKPWLHFYAVGVCLLEVIAYIGLCVLMGWDHFGGYIVGGLFCMLFGTTWCTITGHRTCFGLEKG